VGSSLSEQESATTSSLTRPGKRNSIVTNVPNRFDTIESLEAAMDTIIVKMAKCEFYASIYAESLQVILSTHLTTLSFKESSDSALPKFYAVVVVFQ